MSSQSGISVSSELAKDFPTFVSGNASAAVLVLNSEKEHVEFEHKVSGSLNDLRKHLEPGDKPRYLVIRQSGEQFLFVQFMPDKAPLPLKMKYASSHATVHRQLGGSSTFTSSVFWTELNEVSESGIKQHLDHENAPAPMTEEEKSLATATSLEKAHGTKPSANQAALTVNASISDKAQSSVKTLKDGQALLFTISSKNNEEVIDLADECSSSELVSHVEKVGGPSFVLANVTSEKQIFAFVCPEGSSIKQRMLYASTRITFYNYLQKNTKLGANIETYDPAQDLTIENLRDAVSEKKEEKLVQKPKFNRPKPPRRNR